MPTIYKPGQNKPLPPTDKPGQGYVVAKPAHHRDR